MSLPRPWKPGPIKIPEPPPIRDDPPPRQDRADREAYQRLLREASRLQGRPETHPEVIALALDWLALAARYRRQRRWADGSSCQQRRTEP